MCNQEAAPTVSATILFRTLTRQNSRRKLRPERKSLRNLFSTMRYGDFVGRVDDHSPDVRAAALVPSRSILVKHWGLIGDSPQSRGCLKKIPRMKRPM